MLLRPGKLANRGQTLFDRWGYPVFGYDLLAAGELPDDVVHTRASGDTAFDANGVLHALSDNEPAFDHEYVNGVWVPRGLRSWSSRQNRLWRSQEFDHADWTPASVVVTPNSNPGLVNGTTAYTMASNGGPALARIRQSRSMSVAGEKMLAGFYVRYINNPWVAIRFAGSALSAAAYAWFNIETGELGSILNNIVGYDIIDYGDNGYLIWAQTTADGTTPSAANVEICLADSDGSTSAIAAGAQVELLAAQHEPTSYPTAYVPSLGSSAAASAVPFTKITDLSTIPGYSTSEGTIAVKVRTGVYQDQNNPTVFDLSDGTNNERIVMYANIVGEDFRLSVRNGAATAWQQSGLSSLEPNTEYTAVLAWKSNDFAATVNGEALVTDASAVVPVDAVLFRVGTQYNADNNHMNGNFQRALYFNRRLTNDAVLALGAGL